MMMARPKLRAVASMTALSMLPSRTCRCQSSGRMISIRCTAGEFMCGPGGHSILAGTRPGEVPGGPKLVNHRGTGFGPVGAGVVHHDFNHCWHQLPHDGVGVAQLVAVDATVPGGAAVNQLVSERVQAAENNAHHIAGAVFGPRPVGARSGRAEFLFPIA